MDQPVKRRRIVIQDDDEEEDITSNPDELIDYDNPEEDEGEGEDLMENWQADYAAAPELDFYDPAVLASEDDVGETYLENLRARQAADEEIEAREARMRMRRERDEAIEDEREGLTAREREELESDEDEEDVPPGMERRLNLDAFSCPLKEWIAEDRTRREIQSRFRKFLLTFYPGIEQVTQWHRRHRDEENSGAVCPYRVQPPIYPTKIRAMCAENSSSLEVSYVHLGEMQSLLAIWLTDVPRAMLDIFDEVLLQVVLTEFPHYHQITKEVHVRITELPIADKIRELRQKDIDNLIRVQGVITRRTGVSPQMKAIAYDCGSCGTTLGPYKTDSGSLEALRPGSCINCQARGPFRLNTIKTEYRNFQRITLQETPGSVPPGRVPRYKEVILLGDLIDTARPGEEIDVIGIYTHSDMTLSKGRGGHPTFGTVIYANSVQKRHGVANTGLSEEDKRKIKELSLDPVVGERIIRSIAPSIYGHRHVKTAVALSLFGGCSIEGGAGGTHRVRGDINVLLLGDPGTAKSQVLKYAEKTAPRSVYTTGKGASAVGLTAGVHRDPLTKEWTLEGGALVLADQGVCLIDEFDKMNEQDRTSIHEAMEQQTISVSKAGIVTSLQARCAVIAAANPIGGRYDPSFTLAENVELTDPILQRFDILCVLQDIVDPVVDEQLALFVVNSHKKSHPDKNNDEDDDEDDDDNIDGDGLYGELDAQQGPEVVPRSGAAELADGPAPIEQDMLKKYITYARTHIKPVLHNVDREKIETLYIDLRKQSAISGGVPIAVRHLESVMRMAEASARMHLREHVREDDVNMAIKVMLESFLQAQKVSVRRTLQRSFRKYVTFGEESNQLLMHQLQGLVREEEKFQKLKSKNRTFVLSSTEVAMNLLESRAQELNIYDLRPFYASAIFKHHNFRLDEARQLIIKDYY